METTDIPIFTKEKQDTMVDIWYWLLQCNGQIGKSVFFEPDRE